ncbi:DUF5916 domain-containing protein [Cochleicola gelatinilyticus]|uniref:Hydrolase n=1 Tax=Cochleicola gelatinilyticus TaxID=1763537 RepID=A0A167H219_9FLAO|nr:DUF5916 domain-containing protein [Cochleicola gelatinilyticus]OAB78130.1 hydrolase [Cochleicola gelatinilyticus]
MKQFFTFIYLFYFLLSYSSVFAQTEERKTLQATRINSAPKIDGVLDDSIWKSLPTYGNFFMYEPGNEGIIPNNFKSEVKLAYDDRAVYVAAYLYDPEPEKIANQFSQRDEIDVQADNFAIALNTYNDGINETYFYVTSTGTIGDAKGNQGSLDFSYDVVFEAKVSKDDKGWYAEYKIPYNTLRFPEIETQNWSVNFLRRIIRRNETHSWNLIENDKGNPSQYNGLLTGVTNIDPPVRLTFFPFAQGLISNFDGETETSFSAGMDIKYGLSDSFTLDATLIPDFGQAAFDNVELNLGPFEQTFNEQRQFFTEGVELFNRGNIFFSRRIGGRPSGSITNQTETEIIIENPEKVNLINAIKISGRTEGELGVGFLNAITEKTTATLLDTISNIKRNIVLEPLSNYNVFVLDQQFNGNSSISLVNTNVTRDGSFRDANTSAFVFNVADKGNRFRTSGRAIMSNVNTSEGLISGFGSEIDIQRIKGNFRYRIGHDFANTTFNINDLGVNLINNYNDFVVGMSYENFEPTKYFNKYRFTATARHQRLYQPSVQTGNSLLLESFFVMRDRFAFGLDLEINSKFQDYFEPRVPGRFVTFNKNKGIGGFVSSDYRKKFAYDVRANYSYFEDEDQDGFELSISPRYRFSNRILMIFETAYFKRKNNFGYINRTDTNIFFGQRDITEVENTITTTYNFDPYKAIDLRFRNFWSTADYSDSIFYTLNPNGSLQNVAYDTEESNPNRNFNIWNLDLSFRWRFAPGSVATLLYRNQIFQQDERATLGYRESLVNLFKEAQQNTLSLRITYFIDYNNIGQVFNKNS